MNLKLVLTGAVAALSCLCLPAAAETGGKGTLYLNRVGPVTSELYIANADGSGERKLIASAGFDYHASFSKDGQWLVFTSERDGAGQANLYRVRADGTGLQRLTTHPAVDDAAVFSPTDPNTIAFVSSRKDAAGFGTANIWTLNIATGALRNLTGALPFTAGKPNGYFRPSWSPNGQWLALSSDTGTDWRGHNLPNGWERTQESSIYVIRPDGTGLRKVATNPGNAQGSPAWSPDGASLVFYETPVETTWGARRPEGIAAAVSQLVSVNVTTLAKTTLTTSSGFKVFPQYLDATTLSYHVKGGPNEGLYTTTGGFRATAGTGLRSPRYSADGSKLVFEKVAFQPARPNASPLYSFDSDWAYKYTDVFPTLSRDRKKLAYTEKHINGSIAVANPDFSGYTRVYDPAGSGLDPSLIARGLAGAFQASWSPDRQWLAFGTGQWFFTRATGTARLMRIKADGSMNGVPEVLTDGSINAGFPSYSADGKEVVFRIANQDPNSASLGGLGVLNLETRQVRRITSGYDNMPIWSPDGTRILFNRGVRNPNSIWSNFDLYTVKPDGSDLRRLTDHPASDGHPVWTPDGKQILYNSGQAGYRDEACHYDQTFQPYGQLFVMNADGSGKRQVTDSIWEDSTPQYVPPGAR